MRVPSAGAVGYYLPRAQRAIITPMPGGDYWPLAHPLPSKLVTYHA